MCLQAEKTELLAELAAAQQRLAEAEAGSANLGDLERAELEQHVEGARWGAGGCRKSWGGARPPVCYAEESTLVLIGRDLMAACPLCCACREAVATAQRAADLAETRANEACSELLSIKTELQATQQQLAAQAPTQATPVATLRTKLRGVQDALAGLQSRQQGALPSPGLAAKVGPLGGMAACK